MYFFPVIKQHAGHHASNGMNLRATCNVNVDLIFSLLENYLRTKDKTYEGEVLYQLGFLYIEEKQQKKAVQIFENYLSTKDKT